MVSVMRGRTKVLLSCVFAFCAVLSMALISPGIVPTAKRVSVVAVAAQVKVTYCELIKTTTNGPAIYFSRGRRVSPTYFETEAFIYRHLYRLFKVQPVDHQVFEQRRAYPDFPLVQLTLAMKMSKQQSAWSAGIGVVLTDANGVRCASDRGLFGGCSFDPGSTSEGWTIQWDLGWDAPELNPPIDIVVTNGDGTTLAHLTATKW